VAAEMTEPAAALSQPATGRSAGMRPVVGVLADGTAYFAPVGDVVEEGDRVTCHLCGRLFLSVAAHLRSHGWTKEQYCLAFGLERGQSLEGARTRKLRSAAFTARLVFDPAVRSGSATGRSRARSGDLTRQAAEAARGRAFPEQRRRKVRLARAAVPHAAAKLASRERADLHLAAIAATAAVRIGYQRIGDFVIDRTREGASLAAISREAGLHKDWLSRHLRRVDPEAADQAADMRPARQDIAWSAVVRQVGFETAEDYFRDRHLTRHRSVNAMAAELGMSYHATVAALRRHGIDPVAHAAKRHAAGQRAAGVARQLGFPDIADYVLRRRASGLTWKAICEESGQPQSWLRRHAGLAPSASAGS
jgi:AraC-like DNA-binding protein